jgi:DNA-binding NarL/FixJ family response regulator
MKLLIVDDHAVVREGLAAMLRHAEAISSILQADGGEAGLAIAREHADLAMIILDLTMPGMAGTEAIAAFGAARPDVPIIVLSASESRADAQAALDAGALGYVPKSASSKTLLLALNLVLQGEMYLPPLLLGWASERRPAGLPALTERQTDVLVMLAKGSSNKEIARALRLSDKTVKAHVSAIFRALNVSNRTQAAHAARESGLALPGKAEAK